MCWTPLCAKNTNNVNKTRALLQTTRGKTNRTSFLCGNRNGHHNTDLGTYQDKKKKKKIGSREQKPNIEHYMNNNITETTMQYVFINRHNAQMCILKY